MLKFENPLDPSKDGQNPLIDGIRYNIRNSEMIKEMVIEKLRWVTIQGHFSPMEILEYALDELGYKLDELTVADEHWLLDTIEGMDFEE